MKENSSSQPTTKPPSHILYMSKEPKIITSEEIKYAAEMPEGRLHVQNNAR